VNKALIRTSYVAKKEAPGRALGLKKVAGARGQGDQAGITPTAKLEKGSTPGVRPSAGG